MRFYDHNRVEVMRALPALPRVLFDLYAFDNVDPAEMAHGLDTSIEHITLCLAGARAMIGASRLHRPPCRFESATKGKPIAQLERNVRQQYREWLEATMTASGYHGEIHWPELLADDGAERESIAALILPGLPKKVRSAVERARGGHGIAGMLWRHIPPWRAVMRHHLARLEREVRCSGWLPFEIWLADRIAPDRHYPDGLPISRIIRRPIPDDGAAVDNTEDNGERSPELIAMQKRFDRLPALTQEIHFLHVRYGRTIDEIAERFGIGRRSVARRIRIAFYVIVRGSVPPLRHTLRFEFNLQWALWRRRVAGAWKALRGD